MNLSLDRIAAVMAGAACGGAARYIIALAITARMGGRFPWGTFVINITGCFLIGIISTFLAERTLSPVWGLFVVTGILGGYTTFSAFGLEMVTLSRQGDFALALANALGSVVCGYAAVWLGVLLARR